jgi:hypothetical protein
MRGVAANAEFLADNQPGYTGQRSGTRLMMIKNKEIPSRHVVTDSEHRRCGVVLGLHFERSKVSLTQTSAKRQFGLCCVVYSRPPGSQDDPLFGALAKGSYGPACQDGRRWCPDSSAQSPSVISRCRFGHGSSAGSVASITHDTAADAPR